MMARSVGLSLRQAATRPAGTAISEASATATSTMTALT
jgi:hypothetical protein